MKIRKSSHRSTTSIKGSDGKIEKAESHERLEAVEGPDPTDRFEVGNAGRGYEPEEEEDPEELDEVLQASMDDPVLYQEVARSTLLGMEELPASVDTTWNGVATLLDTERE